MIQADDVLRGLSDLLNSKQMRAGDLFRNIDKDDSGTIDSKELRDGLREIGFRPSDEEFAALMTGIDKDGGGDVSVKEFEKAMKLAAKLSPKKAPTIQPVTRTRNGLTPEDIEDFRQIFCLFKQLCRVKVDEEGKEVLVDWDDSGAISVDELEQLLETVGMRLDPKELQQMVKDMDTDGNGEIDFEEFCSKMSMEINIGYGPEEIAKSFKAFAKNSPAGLIRVHDLKSALKTYMHRDLTDVEVEELMHYYKDCFVRLPGHDCEYFNYQDYIDIMTPMVPAQHCGDDG